MNNLITTLNSKYSHSSLAIRYLKAFVKEQSYCPVLKEYTINQHVDDIVRDIMLGDYKVIAFSCYIWNYEQTLKIAKDIKTIDPEVIIILGGPEVSYDSDKIMEAYEFIDYIIFGEGEITYKALLDYIYLNVNSLETIDGIVYRTDRVYKNKDRAFIEDLDTVPFPYESLEGLEFKKLYYESSRGCPFRCQYCLSSTTGKVRNFSIDRVKEDLMFFIKRNVEQVKFVDRTFNASPKRALEIMKFISENDNGVTNFHFEIVASLLNEETYEFLRTVRIGLFQFEIGVQTTNHETMSAIQRPIDFTKLSDAVKRVSEFNNIHLHLDLIAGLPYEGFDSFLNSFEEVYQLKPEKLQLGFLKLLKGSGLRINQEIYGYAYSHQAPYEIFYSNYITYKELIRLKWVEDILEKYYNSNRFINSLDMIIKMHYNRAVDFYLEFADYWHDNHLFDQPHKPLKLYEILYAFYESKLLMNLEEFKAVLKHDYYSSYQKTPYGFFEKVTDKSFNNWCYNYLSEHPVNEQSTKEQLKHINFVIYTFDILSFIQSDYKSLIKDNFIMLYNYDIGLTIFQKSRYCYVEEE